MQRGRGEPRRFGRGDGFRRGGSGGRGRGGGRGGPRGGRRGGFGGPGARGGKKVVIEPHSAFKGVFMMRSGASDALVTKNMAPGISVYNEKRVTVEVK